MHEKATILIVDDAKENISILLEFLTDYELLVSRSGANGLRIVEKNDVDLILLDIMMPEMDGYQVCEKLKSREKSKNIPILFITAKTDEDSIEKAYDAGGVDYVTKPFKQKELLARVKTHLRLAGTLKSLDYLATRDFMTGIYNRRKFFELGQELFTASQSLFAVMIDIDTFKTINDRYGHPFGDIVIKTITGAIADLIPDNIIFARLGGEEFALLWESESAEAISGKIENIRKVIEMLEERYEDTVVKFTISNGIAGKQPGETMDQLLKRADAALYEAKGTGRNKVCFRE